MSSRHLEDMSSRRLQHMSSKRLEDVFSVTIFAVQDVFARRKIDTVKTCWRRLQGQQVFAGMLLKNVHNIMKLKSETLKSMMSSLTLEDFFLKLNCLK